MGIFFKRHIVHSTIYIHKQKKEKKKKISTLHSNSGNQSKRSGAKVLTAFTYNFDCPEPRIWEEWYNQGDIFG